jgi:hypothetical protein
VGFFANQHGERLVFVQRPGEQQALLLPSHLGWEPQQIGSPQMADEDFHSRTPASATRFWRSRRQVRPASTLCGIPRRDKENSSCSSSCRLTWL